MTIRKLVLVVVVSMVVVGLAATSVLANCGGCGPKKAAKVTCVSGTVKSLCTHSRTLVLTVGTGDKAKAVSLKVCPKVKVSVDGKDAKLEAIKAGAAVKVCHNKDLVAVKIAVGGAACGKSEGGCGG